jgi:hypothetical protein
VLYTHRPRSEAPHLTSRSWASRRHSAFISERNSEISSFRRMVTIPTSSIFHLLPVSSCTERATKNCSSKKLVSTSSETVLGLSLALCKNLDTSTNLQKLPCILEVFSAVQSVPESRQIAMQSSNPSVLSCRPSERSLFKTIHVRQRTTVRTYCAILLSATCLCAPALGAGWLDALFLCRSLLSSEYIALLKAISHAGEIVGPT